MHCWYFLFTLMFALSTCNGKPMFSSQHHTQSSNGSLVKYKVGQGFAVVLPSNPTTGYKWELASGTGAVIEHVSDSYAPDQGGGTGGGGDHTWLFRATSAGTTTLRFEYKRSFGDTTPADVYELTVEVTGP